MYYQLALAHKELAKSEHIHFPFSRGELTLLSYDLSVMLNYFYTMAIDPIVSEQLHSKTIRKDIEKGNGR